MAESSVAHKQLTIAERLVVAVDYKVDHNKGIDRNALRKKVFRLLDDIRDTGVIIKLESVLRNFGNNILKEITSRNLRVFADLKLSGKPNILKQDGLGLREFAPEIVTVMANTGAASIRALKNELPDTEVLAVTMGTWMTEQDSLDIYSVGISQAVSGLAEVASAGGADGVVSAPSELKFLRRVNSGWSIVTPGIRSSWMNIQDEDQNLNRTMSVTDAISSGATRIVVGSAICHNTYPRDAVKRILEEINSVLSK